MSICFKYWAITLGLAGCANAMAATVEVAGVKFEEVITVGNAPLTLNGAGILYRAVFKVMAAGLYLTKKSTVAEEVFATPGPKRMQMTLLRDVEAKIVSKDFIRGFSENANRAEMVHLIPGLLRIGQLLDAHGKFLAGESIAVEWIPGTGAVLFINHTAQGEPFKEVEFFNNLLAIWIGKSPTDWKLKEAVLGQRS